MNHFKLSKITHQKKKQAEHIKLKMKMKEKTNRLA
jgi:hypothetical protein